MVALGLFERIRRAWKVRRIVARLEHDAAEHERTRFARIEPERASLIRRLSGTGPESGNFPTEQARQEAIEHFLANSPSPAELHAFADLWNWDDGAEVLRAVAEHPSCDAGTALMLFWRSEPEVMLEDPEPEYYAAELGLIEAIQDRFAADDFATRQVGFDPDDYGAEFRAGSPIARVMYQRIVGVGGD